MSSLSTGQGTPWGPSRYGAPSVPGQLSYQGDPNAYQGFDRSDLANRAVSQNNVGTANNLAQAKARLAGTGGGRSSAANVQQMNMMNAGENRNADIRNQNALQGWQDKLAQMNAQNQWNLGQNALAQQQYKTSAQLQQDELANRRAGLNQLGPIGGVMNMFSNY